MSEFFSLHWQYISKKTVKDSPETTVYQVGNGFSIPWSFAKGYDFFYMGIELLNIN